MSWKKEYIKWYKIAKEVLKDSIPFLEEDNIIRFVSQNNWLIIPTRDEKDRKESITRSDPNIYFALGEAGKIDVGFVCNTLESVRRFRNLLCGFHSIEKENFINELRKLDDKFNTRVERKIKEQHFQQTPQYETEFEFPTNMVDDRHLAETFEKIDRILAESDELMKREPKSWRTLAPVINITHTVIDRDENKFREVLERLKPAYQIALLIKTDEEIEKEELQRERRKIEERQRRFSDFVQNLKEKGVGGEEYRKAVSKWGKENP